MLKNKNEIFAAAIQVTNDWLSTTQSGDLEIQLLSDNTTVARVTKQFISHCKHRRKVDWDWSTVYHKRIKYQDAWMFALVRRGTPGALCCGRIAIVDRYVSVERLERTPYRRGLRGLVVPTTFQFARAVALLLDLHEVRIEQPFPQLVRHYEKVLRGIRQPATGEVKYISVQVKL